MSRWERAKRKALKEGRLYCEVRGCTNRATQAHHAIVKRDRRFSHDVDHLYNVQMVCWKCHMGGLTDTLPNFERALKASVARYGRDNMIDWLEGFSPKKRPSTEKALRYLEGGY